MMPEPWLSVDEIDEAAFRKAPTVANAFAHAEIEARWLELG
jgi:hypothetical protein